MTNLMIIESPGKIKKLKEILAAIRPGERWQIAASVGHVRDLPARGNDPAHITTGVRKDFTPVYELTERGAEVCDKIGRAVSQASTIFLATDNDREGESISWHLKEALKLKNPVRVMFNEITEAAVEKALQSPGRIDMKRVASQEARRVGDRLVGYLVSTELRRQTGENLSAGRVQSVAVYLVVLRERQIRAFKVTNHYGARLVFADAKNNVNWQADWLTKAGFVTDESPYFMDRDIATQVASLRQLKVIAYEESTASRNPPAPFTTSTMQQAASNALRWNPGKTMQIAQQLYEQGAISYHRSDNPNVSDESMPEILATLAQLGLDAVEKRRKFKAKDGAQEGHPGITPTHWDAETAGETADQQQLYQLIRSRALASQMLPARYAVRTAHLVGSEPIAGKQVQFGATGRTLTYPGWLKLLSGDATEDKQDDEDGEGSNPIPKLEVGQQLIAKSGELLEKKTKAPPRYTEASLVKALESEGIGRPATYAAILGNITARGYIGPDGRFLKPLVAGELVIARLENKFAFLDVAFTRDLETALDLIAEGQTNYRSVVESLYSTLEKELSQQSEIPTFRKEEPVYPCPDCGKNLRRIPKSANGPFWGCTGHPACNTTLPDANGVPGKKKTIELSGHQCVKCQRPLIHRTKKGKNGFDFWGCSGFKEGCTATYPNLKGNKPDFAKVKVK